MIGLPPFSLHLDQARNTGFCVYLPAEPAAGYWSTPEGNTPYECAEQLLTLAERTYRANSWPWPPPLVTLEDVHWVRFNNKTNNPAVWLAKLHGCLYERFRALGCEVRVYNIQQVRAVLGLPSRAAMCAWASTFSVGWQSIPPDRRDDVATALGHWQVARTYGPDCPEVNCPRTAADKPPKLRVPKTKPTRSKKK